MVKKFLLILLTLILLVSCVGCHQDPPPVTPNVLVVYFSATGTTRRVAEEVARVLNCDIFEIQPEQPYTKEHLDWTNKNSRTSVEVNTDDCRPAVATKPDVKPYDVIFVGFPIWWYIAPKIINTFLEQYDLTGKTVVPFATSGGSSFGQTNEKLQPSCHGAKLLPGKVFSSFASERELENWVKNTLRR